MDALQNARKPAATEAATPPVRVYRRGGKAVLWLKAEMLHLTAISDFLKDWLHAQEEYRGNPDQVYRVELAVIEACTNVIRHGGSTAADSWLCVSLRRRGQAAEIHILDRGRAFDPTQAPAPNLLEPGEGGYGIYLIKQLMTGLEYERRGARWNCLRLRHLIPPPAGRRTGGRPHPRPGGARKAG